MTRKLVLILVMMAFSRHISGQELYYLYIHSDDQSGFYVKNGASFYESSGNGHLLIEGWSPAAYHLTIGYKNNPLAGWSFTLEVKDKDLAFTLSKKTGAPSLFAIGEGLEVKGSLMESSTTTDVVKHEPMSGPVSNDAFSRLLADVVNDPTIRLKPVIAAREESSVVTSTPHPTSTEPFLASPADRPAIDKTEPGNEVAARQPAGKPDADSVHAAVTQTAAPAAVPDSLALAVENTLPVKKDPTLLPAAANTGLQENKDSSAAIASIPPTPDEKKAAAVAATGTTVPDTSATIPPAKEEKEPVMAVSNVVVKDVTEERKETAKEEESRPFVLNEVVKNFKRGRKKAEPQATETSRSPLSGSIKKTLEKQTADGTELIYVDETTPGNKETIRILIPAR